MAIASSLHPEIERKLQQCCENWKLAPEQVKVLDFGCGEGGAVLRLRKLGFDAIGVDLRKNEILTGREKLNAEGFDGEKSLYTTIEGESLPFPDQTFHFVFSNEVLEHVDDLSVVSRELHRVTRRGGTGFHVYRPQYNFLEPHFFMPFVHWLPKNRLRKIAILFFSYLGIGMNPPELPPDATRRERGEFLYHYSISRTYYRPYRLVASFFQDGGYKTSFTALEHRKLNSNPLLSRLLVHSPLSRLIEWSIMTFNTGYLFTARPDSTHWTQKNRRTRGHDEFPQTAARQMFK